MSSYRRGRSRSRSPSPSHRRRQDSRDRDSHRDRGQGRDGRDDRDYNRGRPRDYSRERSRERSKERDSRPRQDRDHTRRDDRSRPTNNANSGSGNQQGNNQNHNHNNNHHNNNQGRGGGRHHGNFKRKMKDDGPLRPVTYINTSLKPAEDTAAKQSAAMNSDLPQLIDEAMPGDDDDEVDLSTMMELEDFDLDASLKKQQKAEEETRRQAEERRKRLEDIKAKYQQPPQPPQPASNVDAVEAVKSNGSEDVAVKVVDVEEDLVAEGDMDLAKASASDLPQEGNNNDKEQDNNVEQNEGDQLAREKLALESADQGNKGAFDMFSDSPSDLEKIAQLPNAKLGKRAFREALLDGENPHLQSNWDDGEGYYKPTIGEMVGNRFQILGIVGKGVFSSVLKCLDSQDPEGKSTVAVKMIRNNDTMRKAAEKERQILMQLNEHDKNNKRFCIRLISHLEYRHHIALVFEYQSMNLRETLKKFGKDVGINISAIRIYGRQLFVALRYLMELKIVHADIKLDNILCSEDLKTVKLCDFGSAFHEYDTDNDPTPYLVSRFYRAPEIIMGQQYDRAIDLWSICVCLYELFTGHVMFPGRTNNEMLRLMMAVKGRFPNKMIKNHIKAYETMQLAPHFDDSLKFHQYEIDAVTGKPVMKLVDINQPTRDLGTILRSNKAGADDIKLVNQLTDLLDKGLNLDPTKRLTVVDAMRHPFFAPTTK